MTVLAGIFLSNCSNQLRGNVLTNYVPTVACRHGADIVGFGYALHRLPFQIVDGVSSPFEER